MLIVCHVLTVLRFIIKKFNLNFFSCKTQLTSQYNSMLKSDTILTWTNSFYMQRITM